jgi:uncharacterized NAD(P)/FAD-binding protein YdhS
MNGNAARRVVIIGGGFSGTALAHTIIRNIPCRLHVTIVEPRPSLGEGIAYSTPDDKHLLNAPATFFSLYPEQPNHMVEWLQRHYDAPLLDLWRDEDSIYVPRSVYGEYVRDELRASISLAGPDQKFEHLRASAAHIRSGPLKMMVVLGDGREIEADHIVLATGMPLSRPAFETDALREHPRYLPDPWDLPRYREIASVGVVAIIGTGLTMLDSLVSLERVGFGGRVELISRRGLSVAARRVVPPTSSVFNPESLPSSALQAMRSVQKARRDLAGSKSDWQSLPPAIIPVSDPIWIGASDLEKKRFLRHLRPFWETARHRAAPQTRRLADEWHRQGRLRQRAGRIKAARTNGIQLSMDVRWRGQALDESVVVDSIICCSGAEFDLRTAALTHPLLANLLEDGMISPGPVSFGLDADLDGAVRDSTGSRLGWLSAIGPPLRGVHLESYSMPDIIPQISTLVGRLSKEQLQNF